ncbi:MAG: hypothetical protein J6D00_07870 [Christensenellaceae bacterium]|nr:hypothetical protein [Christensenellaceae bacterium]
MKTVFLTNIKNDFDRELAAVFAKNNWEVIFGEGDSPCAKKADLKSRTESLSLQCEKIDLYIDTTCFHEENDTKTVKEGIDRAVILASFRENFLKPVWYLETVLPLMEKAEAEDENDTAKRIVFINTAESSVNWNINTSGYGYSMARAALNNATSTFVNKLLPLGYTFRMFDPMYGKVSAKAAAGACYGYVLRGRCDDDGDPRCQDERRLVIRDAMAREIPW